MTLAGEEGTGRIEFKLVHDSSRKNRKKGERRFIKAFLPGFYPSVEPLQPFQQRPS